MTPTRLAAVTAALLLPAAALLGCGAEQPAPASPTTPAVTAPSTATDPAADQAVSVPTASTYALDPVDPVRAIAEQLATTMLTAATVDAAKTTSDPSGGAVSPASALTRTDAMAETARRMIDELNLTSQGVSVMIDDVNVNTFDSSRIDTSDGIVITVDVDGGTCRTTAAPDSSEPASLTVDTSCV